MNKNDSSDIDGTPDTGKGSGSSLKKLISFDIDGTLETGNGPGPITLEMVKRAKEWGHIIGSCSDRPVGDQKAMWERAGIVVEFTVLKHMLDGVKSQFQADEYLHIGDTDLDQHYAGLAGFQFLAVQMMDPEPWMQSPDGNTYWGPQGRGYVDQLPPQPSRTPPDSWGGSVDTP